MPGREKTLDIERLRAFAVLFVVVAHINWLNGTLAQLLLVYLRPWSGVDLFFVVSGFVVANAFERDIERANTSTQSVGAFYTKRACRILPTALVCMAVWLICVHTMNRSGAFGTTTPECPCGPEDRGAILSMVLYNIFFVSNFALAAGLIGNQLGWYWSLCVEEHFYLIYPCFRLSSPDTRRRAWILVGVVLVVAFVFRMFLSSHPSVLQFESQMRFDQIALGVLLAIGMKRFGAVADGFRRTLRADRRVRLGTRAVMLLCLLMIAYVPTSLRRDLVGQTVRIDLFLMRVGLVITGVLSFVLVGLAALDTDLLSFGSKPLGRLLVAIGARSYSIYMYHLPAQWFVQEFVQFRNPQLVSGTAHPNAIVIFFYVATLTIIVEANHRLIERPFIGYGRSVLARRKQALEVAAV